MRSMSPALNEDDGLSARFLKRTAIIRRDVTPVKQPYSPFEVPVCIVKVNKGILPPLKLQKNISQTGEITRGGGDMGDILMHAVCRSVCRCMCVHVCACDRYIYRAGCSVWCMEVIRWSLLC